MKLDECWTEIAAVPFSTAMHEVFDQIQRHPAWPFVPVVDADRRPLGIVRECDLKRFAYARFGRELIKRRPLIEFLKPALVLSAEASMDEVLGESAKNPNPDGILLAVDGAYRAALLPDAVLRMFAEQHIATEVRLVQAQKMEAIGTLAGGIAHDLNNILTPIFGYAEMMKKMLAEGSVVEMDMVDQIMVGAKRAGEVVKQILTFSRHQTLERCPLSLGSAIRESLRMIRSSLPSTIEMDLRLGVEGDLIMANPSEIQRILMNLCTNAYHAMREKGRLRISLERHQGPLLGWSLRNTPLSGDILRLSIADTGTGIAHDLLPRIFEPFFTTKQQGEGTGLGLSVVHGIMSRCKGAISVESVPGQGTTFHLYFPCLSPEHSGVSRPAGRLVPAAGSDREAGARRIKVLFVDDEFAITRVASQFLPLYGIDLETTNDSAKALHLFSERSTEFDLLITDQLMPGITGMELIGQVQRIRPDLPIILCTGYTESVSAEQAKALGVSAYLLKPFDFQNLARLVQEFVPR